MKKIKKKTNKKMITVGYIRYLCRAGACWGWFEVKVGTGRVSHYIEFARARFSWDAVI